jgi:antitoxin component YwqK of YwqJK toxin-antitoxin module
LKKIDQSVIDQLPENLHSLTILPLDLPKLWSFVQMVATNIIAKDKEGEFGYEKKWNEIKSQMDMMCTFLFQSDLQKFISEGMLGDLILYTEIENNKINSLVSLSFKNEEIASKVAAVLNPMKAMVLGADISVEKNKVKLKMKTPNSMFTPGVQKSLDKSNIKKIFKANEKLAVTSFMGGDFLNSFKELTNILKLNDFYGIKPKTKSFILSLSTMQMNEPKEWYNWQMIDKEKSLSFQVECPVPILSIGFCCIAPIALLIDSKSDKKIDLKEEKKFEITKNGFSFQITKQKSLESFSEVEANELIKYDNGQIKYEEKVSENKVKIYVYYDYEGLPYRKDYYNAVGIYQSEIISDNGEISETTRYSQKEDGLVEVSNKQSSIIKKYFMKDNEFTGEYMEWYDSKKIKTTCEYLKNKWDGKRESFYENGNKKSKNEYKEGVFISSVGWYLNGSKRFEASVDKWGNGSSIYYYEDGKVKLIIPIKLNSVNGEVKGFYQNGNIAFETCLSFGNIADYIRVYSPYGKIKREEKYRFMTLTHITWYFENGEKEADGDILGFNPCPKWQIFDESGKLKVLWLDIDIIDDNFRKITDKYISIAYPFYNNKYFDKAAGISLSNDVDLPYKSVKNSNKIARNMGKEKVFELLGDGLKNEKFIESTEGFLFNFLDVSDIFSKLEQKDYYLWSIGNNKVQICIFENKKLKEFYQLPISFKP